MAQTLNYYRIYCDTELQYVYKWDTEEPSTCPNNNTHTINVGSITILESISTATFRAEENSEGYFETTHVVVNIPIGTPGDITEHDVTWPMDITLWKTLLTPTSDMIGDSITVLAAPETTIGVCTVNANIGDTTITVNSTVISNIQRGFLVTLFDGVNKNICGRCTAIDTVNGTITFQTPLTHNFLAGTYVQISIYVINNLRIIDTNTVDMGAKGFKGKMINAGLILRIYYTNNSGTSKTVYWRPEYYANG